MKKYLFILPLILATSSVYAAWKSNSADPEETPMNDATANDEDRSAFIDLSKMVAAGDLEGAQSQVIEAATDQGVGFTKSFLEKYFPTVEISFSTKEGQKPTTGILVVAPLSDQKDIENTIFTQVSAFYTDNRTTLNAGLGYRRLVSDNTLMLGVNAFYDHEFPYDHGRYSIGLEARSTVGEINANMYQATTKWKTGKNGQQERALDGWDIEAGLPLPYMNWATVFVKRYEWSGEDGAKDAKGNDVQLRAYVPILPGLEIEAGRTFKDDDKDSNYFTASYNITEAFSNKPEQPIQWFNDTAYKLESMEDRRYEKVRRNNIIVKQIGRGTGFKATVKGI
jgi:adhesin/invasin